MGAGITSQPLEFLLFSDFAVVVAYVHLFTLFMIVPIFNSMARIDRALLEAAVDAGAGAGACGEVVMPLCKTGIALGSIFVVTLVMGDFFVVRTHERRPERVGRSRRCRTRLQLCTIRRRRPTPWCCWSSSS